MFFKPLKLVRKILLFAFVTFIIRVFYLQTKNSSDPKIKFCAKPDIMKGDMQDYHRITLVLHASFDRVNGSFALQVGMITRQIIRLQPLLLKLLRKLTATTRWENPSLKRKIGFSFCRSTFQKIPEENVIPSCRSIFKEILERIVFLLPVGIRAAVPLSFKTSFNEQSWEFPCVAHAHAKLRKSELHTFSHFFGFFEIVHNVSQRRNEKTKARAKCEAFFMMPCEFPFLNVAK